jgi:phosphomannomutase
VDGNFPNHHPDPSKLANLEDIIQAVSRAYNIICLSAQITLPLLSIKPSLSPSHVKLDKPLNIVIDAGNGIAGNIAPKLFERLGAKVTKLFCLAPEVAALL